MHIKFIPKKRCYTHTQARLRTDAFLHRKIFTHRRLVYTQKVSQREPPTHKCPYTYSRNFCADFFFSQRNLYTTPHWRANKFIQSNLYTLQNCSSNAIFHLWPSFPAKKSLKSHIEAAKMTVRSKDSPTAATLQRETGNGKGKRDNNGSTGTGQGDNGVSVNRFIGQRGTTDSPQ